MALSQLAAAIHAEESRLRRGQYHLAVCELWQHVTRLLGFSVLRPDLADPPLPPHAILADPTAAGPASA